MYQEPLIEQREKLGILLEDIIKQYIQTIHQSAKKGFDISSPFLFIIRYTIYEIKFPSSSHSAMSALVSGSKHLASHSSS